MFFDVDLTDRMRLGRPSQNSLSPQACFDIVTSTLISTNRQDVEVEDNDSLLARPDVKTQQLDGIFIDWNHRRLVIMELGPAWYSGSAS